MYIGIALTSFIIGMLPVCFWHPWIGIMMWSWLGYMSPHRLSWFVYSMPYASWVAVATLAGLLFTKDLKPLPRVRETYLLMALWGFFVLTTVFAMDQTFAWGYLLQVSKILLFTFIPLMLFQDARRLRYLFLLVALSIGFFGLKGGIWAIATGGGSRVMMPDDTMLGGSNGAGLALNAVIPMLLYLSIEEKNFWLRRLLQATFVFSIPAVLFTYSRGALLGLVAVVLVLAAKSKHLIRASVGLVILYVFMTNFAPREWFERMDTIQNYEEDNSATSRLEAWKIAYGLALEHPILGGGFGAVGLDSVAERYNPGKGGYNSHSVFFNVLGEHGFVGLTIFLTLVGSCVVSLRSIRRRRATPLPSWIISYSHAMEVSFVGYLVTGAFLSAAYTDLLYFLVAVTILLRFFTDRAVADSAAAAKAAVVVGGRRPERLAHVWNRRSR